MRTYTDHTRIQRGSRMAKIGILVALIFLVGGMIFSMAFRQPSLLWAPFVFLLVGVVAASVGAANMNRWVREPRADQALAAGLKGFDDRYRLYNYLLAAPHVLFSPAGLTVLTAVGADGVITFAGGKFKRNLSVGRLLRFMADEGVGKPLEEGDAQVRALRAFLERNGAADGVDIQNVLVFHNPRARLTVTDPPRPIVVPKTLKTALRKQSEAKLSSAQIRRIEELFAEKAG